MLCKTANKDFVEYVIQDYAKPMGVATYCLSEDTPDKRREALRDVEELKSYSDSLTVIVMHRIDWQQ